MQTIDRAQISAQNTTKATIEVAETAAKAFELWEKTNQLGVEFVELKPTADQMAAFTAFETAVKSLFVSELELNM